MMKNLMVGMIASLILWVGSGQIVNALSCDVPTDDRQFIVDVAENFPIVFVGEVIDVDRSDVSKHEHGTATYRVDTVYKGELPEQFAIEASMWGDPFVGFTYLMFIDSLDEPRFDAAECLNWPVEQFEFDISEVLGDGYAATQMTNQQQQDEVSEHENGSVLTGVGGAMLGITVGGYALWRTRSSKSPKEEQFD